MSSSSGERRGNWPLEAGNRASPDGEVDREGRVQSPLRRLLLKNGQAIEAVPPDDILFIQSDGNYAEFHLRDSYILTRAALRDLEERLDDRFLRIHRSTILNLNHLGRVVRTGKGKHEAVLDDGRRLPVSSTFHQDLLDRTI